MPLTIGNKSNHNATPNAANPYTVGFPGGNHVQNAGAGGFLLVAVAMDSSNGDYTGATYGGEAMTVITSGVVTGINQRIVLYGLLNPPTGANALQISYSVAEYDTNSFFACSFTGSAGWGNSGFNQLTNPNNRTLAVSQNSYIYALATSQFALSTGFVIDGSQRAIEYTHNTYDQVIASLSAKLDAGTVDVNIAYNASNTRVEILEATSGPSAAQKSSAFFMLS